MQILVGFDLWRQDVVKAIFWRIELSNKKTNVLYLAPLLPAPSGSGGKKAVFNHIKEINDSSSLNINYVFVDVEDEGVNFVDSINIESVNIFRRGLSKVNDGLSGKFGALMQMVFGREPRSVAVVTSVAARKYVVERMSSGDVDVVVVDHLNAFGLVRGILGSVPLIYVAHNLESKVIDHQIKSGRFGFFSKFILRIDLIKLKKFEKSLFSIANKIVFIGAADAGSPEAIKFASKSILWAELPALRSKSWEYRKTRRLLFVGSARYFPNRDAIDWLVYGLMPQMFKIDPSVVLHLIGTEATYDSEIKNQSNVVFEGFVSTDRLDEIHRDVDMLVCPVVLGAGIKIKVLEAASYGVPIAATVESLEGVDFLHDASVVIDRDPIKVASDLISLLNDPDKLLRLSQQSLAGLGRALEERTRLDDIILGCRRDFE